MPAGGAAGGVRRSAASPLARLSEAPSHGPIMRIRITDMATAIRPTGTALPPTATAILRPITATHPGLITATTFHAINERLPALLPGKRPKGDELPARKSRVQ